MEIDHRILPLYPVLFYMKMSTSAAVKTKKLVQIPQADYNPNNVTMEWIPGNRVLLRELQCNESIVAKAQFLYHISMATVLIRHHSSSSSHLHVVNKLCWMFAPEIQLNGKNYSSLQDKLHLG